jgi:hypothetical protein
MNNPSMEQMYKLALDPRVYPTDRLLAVMQGRDRSLPMAVAMAAKQKRDQMQVANKGAEAQREARQPTVLEKLVAQSMAPENTGIGALPAQNMEGIEEQSLAGGGIIAFEGGGWLDRLSRFKDSLYSDQEKYLSDVQRGRKTDFPASVEPLTPAQVDAVRTGKTPGPAEMAMPTEDMMREIEASKMRLFRQEMDEKARREQEESKRIALPPQAGKTGANVKPAAAVAAATADKGQTSLADAYKSFADLTKQDNEDYLAKLAGRADKAREGLAKLKRETGGEALMALGQAFLSNPNISRALSAGIPGVMSAASSARKEGREISRLADDLDLNLAKARTAAKQGDRDSQLKFMELANIDKYRMGALKNDQMQAGLMAARLNQMPDAVRTAEFIAANPAMARYFPSVGKQERISMDNALTQWTKAQSDISTKRALEAQGVYSATDLYNLLNQGSIQSATIPGQGAPVIGKL